MFALQLTFERHQTFLHYKSEDAATKAYEKLTDVATSALGVEVTDHYGRKIAVRLNAIVSVLFLDLKRNSECNIELQIAQAEEQATVQSRASASPKIRTMMGAGPVARFPGHG